MFFRNFDLSPAKPVPQNIVFVEENRIFVDMSILFIASFLTMFFLGMPALTSAYARQLGRNARLWFFIGLLLPGIATLLLSILPDLSTSRPKVVQDGNESNQIDGPFVS